MPNAIAKVREQDSSENGSVFTVLSWVPLLGASNERWLRFRARERECVHISMNKLYASIQWQWYDLLQKDLARNDLVFIAEHLAPVRGATLCHTPNPASPGLPRRERVSSRIASHPNSPLPLTLPSSHPRHGGPSSPEARGREKEEGT